MSSANNSLISSNDNVSTIYCNFGNFANNFHQYYIYLSLIVCIFGSISNVLNICVLTSKQMRCATNFILTGLAVADLLVMIEYIPWIIYRTKMKYASSFAYKYAIFVMFHALFTMAFHFISCCLTVILAVWRYVAIKFPQNVVKWCGNNTTRITIFLTYLLCPFVCTPLYCSLNIITTNVSVNENNEIVPKNSSHKNFTIYLIDYKLGIFKLISFYVYGVIIKLVPCILLTVLSILLIVELLKAKERRKKLLNSSRIPDGAIDSSLQKKSKASQRHIENEKQADRTTRMLLVVLLLFLMVEFPQALFGVLNHIIGELFDKQCYRPLGNVFDLFTLINSSINFVLYCIMSKKFRQVFKKLFITSLLPCFNRPKREWTSLQTIKTYV